MIIAGRRDLIFDICYFFGGDATIDTVEFKTDFQQEDSLQELVSIIQHHLGSVLVCTQRESEIMQKLLQSGYILDNDYFFFSSLRKAFEAKVRMLSAYGVQQDEMDLIWNVYDRIFHAPHGRFFPCDHPLYEAEIAEDGQVYLCCSAIMPFSVGSLQSDSFKNIWNSPRARLMRLTAINGTAIFCSPERCGWLRFCNEAFPVVQKQTSDDPLIMNIAVDATCNLSCASCRTGYICADPGSVQEKCDWLKCLRGSFYRNVRDIYVAGNGECMVSTVYQFYLVEELPKYFSGNLHLITNGQVWNQFLIETILDHYCPEVLVSVDAWSRETYETLRRGGKHKTLMENLGKYLNLRKNSRISTVIVRFVVQHANYREIPLFIDHMRQLGVDRMEFTRLVNGGSFADKDFQNASLLSADGVLHPKYLSFFRDNVWPRLGSEVDMDRAYLPLAKL